MSEKNGQGAAPRRKLYRFEDMAKKIDRDVVEIEGIEYELKSPAEVGGEDLSRIVSLEMAVEEKEREQGEAATAEEMKELANDLFNLLRKRTQEVLFTTLSDERLTSLGVAHHMFIYQSFWLASEDDGERLRAAMEATKARVRT